MKLGGGLAKTRQILETTSHYQNVQKTIEVIFLLKTTLREFPHTMLPGVTERLVTNVMILNFFLT